MLIQREQIIAERLLQIRISVRICSCIENTEGFSSLVKAVYKVMVQIRVPVVAERCVQIGICLSVLLQVDQHGKGTLFRLTVVNIVVVKLLGICSERFRKITVGLGIILCIKHVLK